MIAIKDLSEKKKKKILDLLEQEGFKKIHDNGNSIEFSKGLRTYRLNSTDFNDQEDGLMIDFDYKSFMKNQYEEKTRHTVSLEDAIERRGSIEDACDDLEWNIVKEEHFNKSSSDWNADLHTEFIYEVKVGDHTYLIVNETDDDSSSKVKVYAGTMDALWRMGTETAEELFSGSALPSLLKKIDEIEGE
jgi:hypothetical protein